MKRHRFRIDTAQDRDVVGLVFNVNGRGRGSVVLPRAEALALLDVVRAGATALESPGPHVRHVEVPEQLEIVVEEARER